MAAIIQNLIIFLLFMGLWQVHCWRSYRIIQENVHVNITSPDIISEATMYIRKLNRTFDALNSTATFARGFNDGIMISAKSYEIQGAKKIPSVLDTTLDFCKFLESPAKNSMVLAILYPTIASYGNFPRKCPIEPGYYYIYNYNVNEETFPPYFPANRWRFVMTVRHYDRVLFITTWSFRVEKKSARGLASKPKKTQELNKTLPL